MQFKHPPLHFRFWHWDTLSMASEYHSRMLKRMVLLHLYKKMLLLRWGSYTLLMVSSPSPFCFVFLNRMQEGAH